MRTLRYPLRLLSAAVIALVFAAPNARAASILIDAGNIEELVTFTFGQFEGGFSINGSTPTSAGSFTFGEGTQLNFTGQWIDLGASTPIARTVYWVEPAIPTVISEILQWSITPSGPSGLATISGFEQFDGSHDPFQFFAPFLAGQVITGAGDFCPPDICPPVPAPEPATALLFGFGVLGLIGMRQRRRRGAV
jgi:hypothetical protein